jgi:integrase
MEAQSMSWDTAIDLYNRRAKAHGLTPAHVKACLKAVADLRLACPPSLSELRGAHVREFLYAEAKRARAKQNAGWQRTTNKIRAYLRGFFQVAMRDDLLEANPVDKTERFREPVLIQRNLSPQEYNAVKVHCEPQLACLLDWLLMTGCRFSEAAGMRWEDLATGVWVIRRRKRDVQHTVPIPFSLPAAQDARGLVFPAWGAARTVKNSWVNAKIGRACALAGVQPFTCHDLRHAAATWSESAGVGLEDRRKLLGHTSGRMTAHYSHGNTIDGARRAQEAVKAALSGHKEAPEG